eukprot:TRINITY_DN49950_c0_g1_i1.p1 TRINITY_DN49950_c0_g1~~TRINITY_DN49950_c0_g1_i1.p1  ORF type:complete len:287 (+),score=34.77 TRINITY_DN49950_c0_g1_i1:83-862(+)
MADAGLRMPMPQQAKKPEVSIGRCLNGFTFISVMVFAVPSIKAYCLVFDSVASFWFSRATVLCLLLPPLLVFVAHLIHRSTGRPNKSAVLIALGSSSLAILFGGDWATATAFSRMSNFGSGDCNSLVDEASLEEEWQAGFALHKACTVSSQALPGGHRLQDCEGYEAEQMKRPTWAYLSMLEIKHQCGGWCRPAKPIWSYSNGNERDPCSAVVAAVFRDKVQYIGVQLMVFGAVALVLTTVAVLFLGPSIFGRDAAFSD